MYGLFLGCKNVYLLKGFHHDIFQFEDTLFMIDCVTTKPDPNRPPRGSSTSYCRCHCDSVTPKAGLTVVHSATVCQRTTPCRREMAEIYTEPPAFITSKTKAVGVSQPTEKAQCLDLNQVHSLCSCIWLSKNTKRNSTLGVPARPISKDSTRNPSETRRARC